jgi:AraC-like DNA-binding protein
VEPHSGLEDSRDVLSNDFLSWCSHLNDALVPLRVSRGHSEHFRGEIRRRTVGDMSLVEMSSTPQVFERTSSLIAQSDRPSYIVALQLSGTGMVAQDGREAILQPGDLSILDSNRTYTRIYETEFRSLACRFPQNFLDLPRDSIAHLTATRFEAASDLVQLVGPFLSQTAATIDLVSLASKARLMNNAVDLMSTLLHKELGFRNGSNFTHKRSSLIAQISAYIDAHLSDPELSPRDIARANLISTRHLHSIFRDQGVTVSTRIRSLRLARCLRDLLDPQLRETSISETANRWGFFDSSHFSRVFRSAYGESARDVRRRTSL